MRLSNVFLDVIEYTLAAFGALLVEDPTSFLLEVVALFLRLDGDRDAWRRMRGLVDEVGCYLHRSCTHLHVIVGEVFSEVIGVIVIQVDSLHGVIIVVDLHKAHHQNFSREVFGVFFFSAWRWQGGAFLEG